MSIKHTLGAAVEAGADSIGVYCIGCSRGHWLTPEHALELWGTHATFPEIARRSKCQQCKQRASQAAPHWPPASRVRGGEPSVTPPGWEGVLTCNWERFPAKWPKTG